MVIMLSSLEINQINQFEIGFTKNTINFCLANSSFYFIFKQMQSPKTLPYPKINK